MTPLQRKELHCRFRAIVNANFSKPEMKHLFGLAWYGMGEYYDRREVDRHDYPLSR